MTRLLRVIMFTAMKDRVDSNIHDGKIRTWVILTLQLIKARQTAMAAVTVAAGFVAANRGAIDSGLFAWALAASALAMSGASALNEWVEIKSDASMDRTRRRPIPSGGIAPSLALVLGLLLLLSGVLMLAVRVNVLSSALAAFGAAVYILLYTPLKYRTSLSTHVGAICGALPPVIGWTAAAGRYQYGALILFAIMFIWQVPHTLALSCFHKDDSMRGGLRVLPVTEVSGRSAARMIVLYSVCLLPISILPAAVKMAGSIYLSGALALGSVFLFLAILFYLRRTEKHARQLFICSVLYLPLLLLLLVLNPGLPHSGPDMDMTISPIHQHHQMPHGNEIEHHEHAH